MGAGRTKVNFHDTPSIRLPPLTTAQEVDERETLNVRSPKR